MDWINIHTHKIGEGINIVDPCLGNVGSCESGTMYNSLGIHPMDIIEADILVVDIERAASEGVIVAVGEVGLDRRNVWVSIGIQKDIFELQVEIAARYDLPLIIHVVRAIPELIEIYKKYSSHKKWIIHGFDQSLEVLQELLKHGFYISVGRQIMNEESNACRYLLEIPNARLFLETDDSNFGIAEIYQRVAELRGISIQELQKIVTSNFKTLFNV